MKTTRVGQARESSALTLVRAQSGTMDFSGRKVDETLDYRKQPGAEFWKTATPYCALTAP